MDEIKTLNFNERNYGIDLLRIVAMIMVILIHSYGYGGLSYNAFGANHYTSKLIYTFCEGAVNCFALISGFVGYKAKHKFSNIFYLIIQVAFWAILLTTIYKFRYPSEVENSEFVFCAFPFVHTQYWYFRAYFCVFLFIPFMNLLIDKTTRNQANFLIITIFIVFSVIPTYFSYDAFILNNGLSPLWIALLYIVGAYLSKYNFNEKYKKKYLLLVFLICITITYLWDLFSNDDFMFLKKLTLYTSPTLVIGSICLVLLFSKIKIGSISKKIVKFFTPLTFSVYIIHMSTYVINKFFRGFYIEFVDYNPFLFPIVVIGASILIFIICALIDYLRLLLFKLCRVKQFCNFLEKKIRILFQKLLKEKDEEENNEEEVEKEVVN